MFRGGAHCARPSENMLLFFTVWSEGPQILVQFIYHSDIGCTESLEPKVCLKKNWSMFFDAGVKNQKFKNGKMTPKTILYHAHTKNKKLLFSWPCLFRPLFKRYGCYRDFFEFFWNFFWSTLSKNLFFQRLDMKIFEHFLVYFLIWCQKCPLNMFTKGRAHCAPPRNT